MLVHGDARVDLVDGGRNDRDPLLQIGLAVVAQEVCEALRASTMTDHDDVGGPRACQMFSVIKKKG
jgi:hypothetical protein